MSKNESQAVPSELASLRTYEPMIETAFGGEEVAAMSESEDGEYVKLSDVQSLFSHSAATGKVPEDERAAFDAWFDSKTEEEQNRSILSGHRMVSLRAWEARAALASPAAPLAGKAEDTADVDRFWNKAIEAEAEASRLRQENEELRAALKSIVETPSKCIAIADVVLSIAN